MLHQEPPSDRSQPRGLWVAIGFLTRLPTRATATNLDGTEALSRSRAWFPLVGALVAGISIAGFAITEPLLGSAVAAVVAVAIGMAATGAFHEDGLADTFDGLWGGWTPERRLEIMRDSRIGTYGAAALVLSLLLRVALLGGLTVGGAARALLVGHVVGRAAGLVMGARLQPVRPDGRGTDIHGAFAPGQIAVAGTVTLLALVAAAGTGIAAPVGAAVIAYAVMERLARARLGGFTGDVLGATTQVVHVATMASVVALIRMEVPWWAL